MDTLCVKCVNLKNKTVSLFYQPPPPKKGGGALFRNIRELQFKKNKLQQNHRWSRKQRREIPFYRGKEGFRGAAIN